MYEKGRYFYARCDTIATSAITSFNKDIQTKKLTEATPGNGHF